VPATALCACLQCKLQRLAAAFQPGSQRWLAAFPPGIGSTNLHPSRGVVSFGWLVWCGGTLAGVVWRVPPGYLA
jgi:hypothetical protein